MSCGYDCEYSCEDCDVPDMVIEFVKGYNQALEDFKKELIKIYHKRYMHDIYLDDIDDIVERLHK